MTPDGTAPESRSERFTRAQRLLTAADFKRVFAKAERSADRYWTVLAREHTGQQRRLGLAITKKVVRSAAARTRLKRLARESFRKYAGGSYSADYVVLVRRDAIAATNATLSASLSKHWKQLDKQTG